MSSSGSAVRVVPFWLASAQDIAESESGSGAVRILRPGDEYFPTDDIPEDTPRSFMGRDSDSGNEARSRSPHREAPCKNIAEPLQIVSPHVVPAAPCKNIAVPLEIVLMNRLGKLETFSEVRQTEINQLIDLVHDDQEQLGLVRDRCDNMGHNIDALHMHCEERYHQCQGLEASSVQLQNDLEASAIQLQNDVDLVDQAVHAHSAQININSSKISTLDEKLTAMMSRIERLEKENAKLKVQLRQQ